MEFVVTISLIGEQHYYMADRSSTKKLAEATKFPTIGEAMAVAGQMNSYLNTDEKKWVVQRVDTLINVE